MRYFQSAHQLGQSDSVSGNGSADVPVVESVQGKLSMFSASDRQMCFIQYFHDILEFMLDFRIVRFEYRNVLVHQHITVFLSKQFHSTRIVYGTFLFYKHIAPYKLIYAYVTGHTLFMT